MNKGKLNLYNADCMPALEKMKDNQFDLAIVDPPYGIGADVGIGGNNKGIVKKYIQKWDGNIPDKEYFDNIKRISKNQIIWGVNYFNWLCGGRIVWDKDNTGNFSDCEIAYQSFSIGIKKYKYRWNGMIQGDMKNKENRIHPTQKPVALYKWLLTNYAKEGDTILDTHLGSMSIAIACYDLGFDLTGYELDNDYFEAGMKRVKNHTDQLQLI